eukprot:UN32010
MSKSIKIVVQKFQDGLGHAVYQAKHLLHNSPFLLMLGDHLYQSLNKLSCVEQLLKQYNGGNLVGLKKLKRKM